MAREWQSQDSLAASLTIEHMIGANHHACSAACLCYKCWVFTSCQEDTVGKNFRLIWFNPFIYSGGPKRELLRVM